MSPSWLANTCWMLRCRRAFRTLRRSLCDLEGAQTRVLRRTIAANADSRFGRQHGFSDIHNIADYRARVPIRTYEQFAPWIAKIAAGAPNVLTRERVMLFEPTSGSVGPEKLIPYTASLRRQFQLAIDAWIFDLFRHRPSVRQGRAYWSLPPAMDRSRRTEGGIPIGFDNDTAYLGVIERQLARNVLVVPAAIARQTRGDVFRYLTLLHLLAASDLALISVWSPTFLTSLLADLPTWSDRLTHDLNRGSFSFPTDSAIVCEPWKPLLPRPAARRAGAARIVSRA